MENLLIEIDNKFKNHKYQEALKLCENYKEERNKHIILNIKGAIFTKLNELVKAESNFLNSIHFKKDFLDPYKNLYLIYIKLNRYKDAIKCCEKIIEFEKITSPETNFKLAFAYENIGNYYYAKKYYEISDKLGFKDKIKLYNNLGNIYLYLGQYKNSEDYFLKALKLNNNNITVINNLFRNSIYCRDKTKADFYIKKLDNLNQITNELNYNKAEFLIVENKIHEAIDILIDLNKKPTSFIIPLRLASLYQRLGKDYEAENIINNALNIFLDNSDLKSFKGMILLKKGDFKKGWEFYEFRKSKLNERFNNIKEWKGEKIQKNNLLIYSEQGIGDTIQFSKYLKEVSNAANEIDFLLSDKINLVLKNNFNNIKFCSNKEINNKKYDFKISLGSLNKFYYNRNIISEKNLIKINNKKLNYWLNKIDRSRINIGLVWSGYFFGPKEPYRSIKLEHFKNILKLDVNFYSLQNEIWERDKNFLKNCNIINYGDLKLDDVVAIIENLDLIISTDTSILHLACALNKPTWGLLSLDYDWRWGKFYELNSYKTLKIFNQKNFNDWNDVLKEVETNIKSYKKK